MKKLVLFLLFGCVSFVYSQEKLATKKLDSLQFVSSVDKILRSTGVNFVKIDSGNINHEKYYKYVNKENEDEQFFVVYTKRIEGKNVDLEIPGKLVWNIERVLGKFLTIFDLYKEYYSPKADKTKILDLGQEWNKTQSAASIRRTESGSPIWEIRIWEDM